MMVFKDVTVYSDISPNNTSLSFYPLGFTGFPGGRVLKKYSPFPLSLTFSPSVTKNS